jgi:antitoxin CcdA
MTMGYDAQARKRRISLTLNEDLIKQARSTTRSLSGVVEGLLADYVAREIQKRSSKATSVQSTVAMWNEFNANVGSITDEHSSL